MMNRRTFILALPLLPALLYPTALQKSYPNFETVFEEFDIQASYIENPDFMKFVTLNEEKYRRFYKNSLKRGAAYIPMFKQLLISQGLSDLFIYMSMTESGFQTYARSPKQAAGLWQFMAATAKRFNLKVEKDIDERYDPVASTEAASKYIRFLYSLFGKWYLVLMAYNCGEGRLKRAIEKARTDDFETLMSEEKRYIPAETRRYIQKILLLSMMGERIRSSKKSEEKRIKREILPDSETLVNIYGGTTLEEIAALIHADPGELYRLNPQIKGGVIPPEISITQIFIPTKKLPWFRAYYHPPTLKEIFAREGYTKLVTHIVKGGETLRDISSRYRIPELDITIANSLRSRKVHNGQILMIPMSQKSYDDMMTREMNGI
jgi:membrane-bound lytic murein transglycosylase D